MVFQTNCVILVLPSIQAGLVESVLISPIVLLTNDLASDEGF